MRSPRRQGLIALNVTLLTLLAIVTLAPLAQGQGAAQPGARVTGAYTMVGGQIVGGSPSVVYIVDANNNEMVAVRWINNRLEGIGYRDLAADSKLKPQGGPR
jgi:hypothetical protein